MLKAGSSVRFSADRPRSAARQASPTGRGSRQRRPGSAQSEPTLEGYVRSVRRALRRRPDDYLEFAAVAMALHRPLPMTRFADDPGDEDSTVADRRIAQIERLVTLLDGHPKLIAGLKAFLPPEYSIDIQHDAVIIKVYGTDGDYSLVDTGHCRPVDPLKASHAVPTSSTTSGGQYADSDRFLNSLCYNSAVRQQRPPSATRPTSAAAGPRSRSCPPAAPIGRRLASRSDQDERRQSAMRPQTATAYCQLGNGRSSTEEPRSMGRPKTASFVGQRPAAAADGDQPRRRRRRPASASFAASSSNATGWNQSSDVGGTMSYVMEVKRALAKRPDVYRQFVIILRRCHSRRSGNDPDEFQSATESGGSGDVESAMREVVSLLRMRPQLVLGFNDFLPGGYRIKLVDSSAYVLEYPDDVGGTTRLRINI